MPSPNLKYAYFPGCVAQGAARELYLSTAALAQALGIELVELKKLPAAVLALSRKIRSYWKILSTLAILLWLRN
jgi:heterodisulfide reductase subunit B